MQFANIRDVQPLGETPEGYICTLDLDLGDGAGFVAETYVARPGGGGISDAVIAWIECKEAPVVSKVYSKARLFLAMTDAEYVLLEAAAAAAVSAEVISPRQMAAFNHAAELHSDSGEFAIFRGLVEDTLGSARANALLLRSEI